MRLHHLFAVEGIRAEEIDNLITAMITPLFLLIAKKSLFHDAG
jgi:hypothetical protein